MLNRAVFQVPDIGQAALQLGQKRQAEQERETQKRQATVAEGGIDEKFFGEEFGMLPKAYKAAATEAFNVLKEKSTKYLASGSQSDKDEMMYSKQQFNQIWGAAKAATQYANTLKDAYMKTGGKDFAERSDEFNNNMSQFYNRDIPMKVENGLLLVDGVPFSESPLFAMTPNEFNTPKVTPIDPRSRHMDVTKRASEYVSSFQNSQGVKVEDPEKGVFYNQSELIRKSMNSFETDFKNPEVQDAVVLRHVFKNRGVNPNELNAREVDDYINQYKNNPELMQAAKDEYVKDMESEIKRMTPASNLYKPSKGGDEQQVGDGYLRNLIKRDKNGKLISVEGFRYRMPENAIKLDLNGINYKVDTINFDKDGKPISVFASKKTGDDPFAMLDASTEMSDPELITAVVKALGAKASTIADGIAAQRRILGAGSKEANADQAEKERKAAENLAKLAGSK